MAAPARSGAEGIPPFHLHPGHAFEGFELIERSGASPILVARCECGAVLDVSDARFAACRVCYGRDSACLRCSGTGRVVDHAALEWRVGAQ